MNIKDLQNNAKRARLNNEFSKALNIYIQIWKIEKSEWTAFYISYCNRKLNNFEKARNIALKIKQLYPNFKNINSELLWIEANFIDAYNSDNSQISKMINFIKKIDINDKYEYNLYVFVVFNIVSAFIYKDNLKNAFNWLITLDFTKINNNETKNIEIYIESYTIERKTIKINSDGYFFLFSYILTKKNQEIDYIETALKRLNYNQTNLYYTLEHIKKTLRYNGNININVLIKYISRFKKEFYIRKNNIQNSVYDKDKTTLISDINQFEFCPVSYAIRETYNKKLLIKGDSTELKNSNLFINRYNLFKQTKNYKDTFIDTDIDTKISTVKKDFDVFFNSNIRVNNATNPKPTIYFNKKKDIAGAPDYIMEKGKKRYIIIERFTSNYSKYKGKTFDNEMLKPYLYLQELKEANFDYAYLLTWYTEVQIKQIENIYTNRETVVSYKINKISKKEINKKFVDNIIEQFKAFKNSKRLILDNNYVFYANKCVKCSYFTYCNHKTGRFKKISLPYNLSDLKINKSIKFNINEKMDSLLK